MSRPIGRRNADYEEARARLLERLQPALLRPGGAELSFSEMAEAAGVSAATLRHYFRSRDQLLTAVLEALHSAGLPFLHSAATLPIEGVRASLEWLLLQVAQGWRFGVGAIHALGLRPPRRAWPAMSPPVSSSTATCVTPRWSCSRRWCWACCIRTTCLGCAAGRWIWIAS